MKHSNLFSIISALLCLLFLGGCSKDEFLNERPHKSILTPKTLDDFQAVLDMDGVMNGLDGQGLTPQLGESGADNFYLLDASYNTDLRPQMQNYYTWKTTPYAGLGVLDWEYPYKAILYANLVLDELNETLETEDNAFKINSMKGQAFYHRAHMYYQLAQVFAPPYDINGNNEDIGLPLRLIADINEKLNRATVKSTYEQIFDDLSKALPLLGTDNIYKHRPSKQAAYGLFSRIYLTIRDYEKSKLYADSCLAIQNDLLDYNLINVNAAQPFRGDHDSPINKEIIFMSGMLSAVSQNYPTSFNRSLVDSALYDSYHVDDLRRYAFFEQRPIGVRFKGSYSYLRGRTHFFSGLAVDEILLTRAESYARLGNLNAALADLNKLLTARWAKSKFKPYSDLNSEELLDIVLEERRKELLYRGLRWSDIRRLNQEEYNISVSRTINGENYILQPGDPRWVWPFPPEVSVK